jgi:hypothetical protein
MLSILKFKVHPSLRPILLGITGFAVLNVLFTVGVTFSPLNSRFNLRYGNFLPLKISLLKQIPINKPYVLFLGTSQTNNGCLIRRLGKACKVLIWGFPTIATILCWPI